MAMSIADRMAAFQKNASAPEPIKRQSTALRAAPTVNNNATSSVFPKKEEEKPKEVVKAAPPAPKVEPLKPAAAAQPVPTPKQEGSGFPSMADRMKVFGGGAKKEEPPKPKPVPAVNKLPTTSPFAKKAVEPKSEPVRPATGKIDPNNVFAKK